MEATIGVKAVQARTTRGPKASPAYVNVESSTNWLRHERLVPLRLAVVPTNTPGTI